MPVCLLASRSLNTITDYVSSVIRLLKTHFDVALRGKVKSHQNLFDEHVQ